jgi:hypothetical protein
MRVYKQILQACEIHKHVFFLAGFNYAMFPYHVEMVYTPLLFNIAMV